MRRPGLTIVQLLIVIMVTTVIIGIFTPLVLEVRRQAARTETTNSMEQCALVVHKFHDTYRCLPDAFNIAGIYPDKPMSMWFHLLPYVESQRFYETGIVDAVV